MEIIAQFAKAFGWSPLVVEKLTFDQLWTIANDGKPDNATEWINPAIFKQQLLADMGDVE